MSRGYDRQGLANTTVNKNPKPVPDIGPTLTQSEAKSVGYTGNMCDNCGSVRMRVTGHCMTCEECGSTTGCS